jgi:serine phosphatase RsbU (regulator of sigma subunit)
VEGTLGGRAFTSVVTQGDVAEDGSLRLWIPMVDGAERVGLAVLKVAAAPPDSPQLRRSAELMVALIAHLVSVKMPYGDLLHRVRRTQPMQPSGELLLSLLPPLTFSCRQVVIASQLEPCYDVGGDAFDYAVDGSTAYFMILDAMGRGMQAALTSAAVLAATRAARRAGADLAGIARAGDTVLAEQFPQFRFVTAVFGELDTVSGRLRYVNAGHPQPAVLRRGELRQTLGGGRRLPLGLPDDELVVGTEHLQPGDRLLLHTDGVTETQEREAPATGVRWLVDAARRSAPDGLPAPEWLRLLAHTVITQGDGRKVDDATLMLVEWRPDERSRS